MSAPGTPLQPEQRFDRQRFRTLLGMYILGLALGFIFLGIIVSARYRAARQQQQQQQAGQPSPQSQPPAGPP